MLCVLVLLVCAPCLLAYPDGAPEAQCGAMMPNHGADPQTSAPPYSITLSKSSYKMGDVIDVTVAATSDAQPFKGFLLEARSGTSTDALGVFDLNGDSQLKLLNCPGGSAANNAVTHNSNADKTTKTFKWTAPDSSSDIFFQATIVNVKVTLWKDVKSATLKASSAGLAQANVVMATILVAFSFLFQ